MEDLNKILITGATGFVGINLLSKLSNEEKYSLSLVVRDKNKAIKLFGDKLQYIEFNEKDLSYKQKIKDFNPEIVIHLASYSTSKYDTGSLEELLNSNIRFGSLILDALLETDVKYFINTGSFSEYYKGIEDLDPAYLYSATKIAFRQMVDFYRKTIGFKVVQVVPYTIYGPNDVGKKVIHYIIDSINSLEYVPMTEGNQVLDFVYITDVADFYLNLINNIKTLKNDYNEYHLGTGVGTSIREVATIIEEITNKKTNIKWGSIPYRPRDIMHTVAPISKAIAELKWKPMISIKEGLEKTINAMEVV